MTKGPCWDCGRHAFLFRSLRSGKLLCDLCERIARGLA